MVRSRVTVRCVIGAPDDEAQDAAGDRFESVFEHAPDAMIVADADGRVGAVNARARALLGAGRSELAARHVATLWSGADEARVREGLGALGPGESAVFEHAARSGGDGPSLAWRCERIPDGRLVMCARDDAPRRRLEDELRVSDARMRATIDGRPDLAVQWYDRQGRVRLWNRASERMFGFTSEEALGKTLADLIYDGEQQREFVASLAEIERSGQALGPVELTFRRRDGTTGTCLSTIFPIPGRDDAPYFVCMDVDLSEHKRVEAELRQAQKEEVLGRLAGGMAHDFNNLLTAIIGFAELGRANLPAGAEATECFDFILEAAQRGAALTSNLLAFARKKVVAPRAVIPREVVDRLLPLLRPLIGEHIELVTRHDASTTHVLIDVGSLEQVIMNLVVNARDAMPRGGKLTLETRLATIDEVRAGAPPPGRYVQLAVGDTGVGVPPEVQARVFEPFFTTKGVGQGTGLGLATCAGIVRQAGGWIGLESGADGTIFRVYLPAIRPPHAEPEAANDGRDQWRGDETILLVEDDPTVRRLMSRVLLSLGYRMLVAADGREALEVAAAHHGIIHLLLTDLVMPEIDGLALADELVRVRPGLRVLLCSGYSDGDALANRNLPMLAKPYAPAMLAQRVRETLDGRG